MRSSYWCTLFTAALLLLPIGCAEIEVGPEADEAVTTVSESGLTIHETADGATGEFQQDGMYAWFSARLIGDHILDIEIRFNDMTVTVLSDMQTQTAEYDGYTEDGGETQLLDEDRELLAALSLALEDLGMDVAFPVMKLRTFASVYSEFPSSKPLTFHPPIPHDYDHHTPSGDFYPWYLPTMWSGYSICDHMNGYTAATHPSSWHNYSWTSDQRTLSYAYVSMHQGQCGGSYDDTKFLRPAADHYLRFGGDDDNPTWEYFSTTGWQCFEPDHLTRWNGGAGWNGSYTSLTSDIEYGYGLCLGRCGGGCGSSTQMTSDCLNHDECVRIGHDTAATVACDMIFDSTMDDWLFAPDC